MLEIFVFPKCAFTYNSAPFFMLMPLLIICYKGVFLSFFTILIFTCVTFPYEFLIFFRYRYKYLLLLTYFFFIYFQMFSQTNICVCVQMQCFFYYDHLIASARNLFIQDQDIICGGQRILINAAFYFYNFCIATYQKLDSRYSYMDDGIKVRFKTMVCHRNSTCWCFNTKNYVVVENKLLKEGN